MLQCQYNIISMIVSTFCYQLTFNTLLKCYKSTNKWKGQVYDGILYLKHDNISMYDVLMWNWAKYAICDDLIFM
jgi:hypothetical protein